MRLIRNPIYNRMGMVKRVVTTPIPRLPYPRGYAGPLVHCPEEGRDVAFVRCLKCPKFRVWNAQDGDFRRCWYEFKDLESRGQYDGTWGDHPENFDPETFAEIQERKRINEQFARDFEREKAEMERQADELEQEEEAEEKPLDEEDWDDY